MKCNSIFLCLLFIITTTTFITAKAQAADVNDSLALVDLYNSTDGNNWKNHTNWLTSAPVSTWFGITVENARVKIISLGINNLTGTIPNSIGNLINPEILDLHSNSLTGSIPNAIGNLVKLTSLQLWSNQLTGSIPAEIGNLTNLQYLLLGGNQLSGSIPSAITNLVNLQQLSLYTNQLTGSIPANIGNLAELRELILSNNQLSGSIPASIGNLIKFNGQLDLSFNQFTGTIPSSIGNLTKLRYLFLGFNQLSGPIPESIGNLAGVFQISLRYNQLSGSIPASISNPKILFDIYLDSNKLSGSIPAEIGNMKNLSTLNLSYNHLSGPIPNTFRKGNFYTIDLSHNRLSQDKNIQFAADENLSINGYISYNLFNFDGLQFIAQKYPHIHYARQNTVLPIHQNGNILSVYAGGFLKKNTYTWHKAGATDSIIIRHDSTFTPAESGRYYVTVYNSIATKTRLHSDTIDFVLPAMKQSSNILIAKTTQPATIIKHTQVFPNPAKDIIHIQTNGSAIITITNSAGKVILTKSINSSAAINVSAFASGTYYIQNKTSGEAEKIIIAH